MRPACRLQPDCGVAVSNDNRIQLDDHLIPEGRDPGTDAPLGRHLRRKVARLVDVLEFDECTPELKTSVKAAYAGTYKLRGRHEGLQHEVIEEAVFNALENYSRCACGNIWVTCPKCGGGESKKNILPFTLEGLRKLTLRFVDRVLRRAERRELTPEQLGGNDEDKYADVLDGDISIGAGRASWIAAQRVEDNMVAQIDAKRGHINWSNRRLVRFLASLFTSAEVASIGSRLTGDKLARLRENWLTLIYSR